MTAGSMVITGAWFTGEGVVRGAILPGLVVVEWETFGASGRLCVVYTVTH